MPSYDVARFEKRILRRSQVLPLLRGQGQMQRSGRGEVKPGLIREAVHFMQRIRGGDRILESRQHRPLAHTRRVLEHRAGAWKIC